MIPSEIEALIDGYIDRRLNLEQAARLRQLMKTRRDVQMEYFKRVDLLTGIMMKQTDIEIDVQSSGLENLRARQRRPLQVRQLLLASATLVTLLLLGFVGFRIFQPIEVASIAHTTPEIKFSEGDYQANQRLKTGEEIEIINGVLKILLDQGAEVIIAGPAKFKPLSDHSIYLFHGQCDAYIGTAEVGEFFIETPNAMVRDYGTHFALDVEQTGETDVSVLSGGVTLASRHGDRWTVPISLRGDQACRVDLAGVISSIPFQLPQLSYPEFWTEGRKKSSLEELDEMIKRDGAFAYWRGSSEAQETFHDLVGDSASLIKKRMAQIPGEQQLPTVAQRSANHELLVMNAGQGVYLESAGMIDGLFADDFTIEMLVKIPQPLTHQSILFGIVPTTRSGGYLLVEFTSPADFGIAGEGYRLRASLRPPDREIGGIDSSLELLSPGPIMDGQVYSIIIRNRQRILESYLNGILLERVIGGNGPRLVVPTADPARLRIGVNQPNLLPGKEPAVRFFRGQFYYLALYRKALDRDVISEHANSALKSIQGH